MLLNADFFARYPGAKTLCNLRLRSQILADRDPNVFQRLLACRALAVAARKVIAPNGESFFGLHERHVIFHRLKVQYSKNILKFFLLHCLGFSVREADSFSLIHSKPRLQASGWAVSFLVHKTSNIEHPTSNAEHMNSRADLFCIMKREHNIRPARAQEN